MDLEPTIRCPHCRMQIQREGGGKTALSGSPFRSCPGCGRIYFDEAYEEPALRLFEERKPRFNYIKILYALLPTVGSLVYLKAWRSGANPAGKIPALVFGALAVFFLVILVLEIVGFLNRRSGHAADVKALEGGAGALSPELAASLERLRDPKYLDTLESCGVDVPDFFRKRI